MRCSRSPTCRQARSHFTAELTLTSKRSAASCRDAPAFTASITRLRRSPEYDFGLVWPPGRINADTLARQQRLVNPPRFKPSGNRSSVPIPTLVSTGTLSEDFARRLRPDEGLGVGVMVLEVVPKSQ